MAMHYNTQLFIDGVNRTGKLLMPLKWGDFLDERLDEAHISLRAIKKQNFLPLTPVEIVINQTEYYGDRPDNDKAINKVDTLYYVVSDDDATEITPGSGLYSHELGLIEVTKAAERVVADTLTFTNSLGQTYTASDEYAEPVWE